MTEFVPVTITIGVDPTPDGYGRQAIRWPSGQTNRYMHGTLVDWGIPIPDPPAPPPTLAERLARQRYERMYPDDEWQTSSGGWTPLRTTSTPSTPSVPPSRCPTTRSRHDRR